MPSQEDYLDNLLKDLTTEFTGAENIAKETEPVIENNGFDVESTAGMTEEDIERMLSASMLQSEETPNDVAPEKTEDSEMQDLMSMLQATDDEELQDIHDLLQKSDQNEAVDDGIMSFLQDNDSDMVFDPLEDDTEKMEAPIPDKTREKEQRAEQRRREREEKKAAKAARKAEAKQAKAAKAMLKAEKKINTKAVKEVPVTEDAEQKNTEDISEPLQGEDLASLDELLNAVGVSSFETGMKEQGEVSLEDAASLVDNISSDKTADTTQKKGFFTKLLDFFTEEDEEETTDEEIKLSDENKNILEELDKNKRKKKDKRGKKGKKDTEENSSAEGDEESSRKDKKSKKEKKPKKEKVPNLVEEEQRKIGSKLSIKRILPIVLICLTVGGVIILAANISSDYSARKTGHKAYYNGDYQTCYQNLYGKDLNESEQVMFGKSESILRVCLWIREYELLAEEGLEAEALDSLIQSVNDYPALYDFSTQWNAGTEVAEIYAQMLSILNEKYHLTEEQALEIASVTDDVEYSRMVYAIVKGETFDLWNEPEAVQEEVMKDILPEEEELDGITFVDNN